MLFLYSSRMFIESDPVIKNNKLHPLNILNLNACMYSIFVLRDK
jgi:hypothetical protein